MTEKDAGTSNTRVYSYVANDGTVFWSLTKLPQTVSTRRLVLQSRTGTALSPYIVFLREQAALGIEVEEIPVEGETEETPTGK